MKLDPKIQKLVERKKGLLLDISLGGTPQERAVTLGPKGDIQYDPTWSALQSHFQQRFPLPDECVHTSVVTHVLEYVAPQQFFAWWDELWRVTQPEGICFISGPYGGDESQGWLTDPMHRTRVLEASFAWLDPRTPMYELHPSLGRGLPKPWHPVQMARVPGTHGSISYNVKLVKQPIQAPSNGNGHR